MKVLYALPSLESVYAARFVYEGLKNAFIDLSHKFRTYTSNDNLEDILEAYRPDIFFHSLNFYHLKFIELDLLEKYRKKGAVVFCQIGAWHHLDNVSGLEGMFQMVISTNMLKILTDTTGESRFDLAIRQ